MIHFQPKTGLLTLAGLVAALILVSCEAEPKLPEGFSFAFAPKEVTIPAAGGTAEVAFNSPMAWEASTEADWIQFTPTKGEPGDVVLKITIGRNPARDARSAGVTVSIPSVKYQEPLKVTQAAHDPALTLSEESVQAPAAGGIFEVTVASTVNWTLASDAEWLIAEPVSGGFGEEEVSVLVEENPYAEGREGHLTFTGEGKTAVYTVVQTTAGAVLEISKTEASFGKEGGSEEFIVTSNIEWTVAVSAEWLSAQPLSGGFGETSVAITVQENPYPEDRTATITVSGAGLSQVLTVSQSSTPAWLTVSQDQASFTKDGGSVEITVASNIDWTVASSAEWLTAEPVSGGFGETKVVLQAQANPYIDGREATVTVSGSGLTQEIKVAQEPTPAWLSISKNAETVASAGAAVEVKVGSNIDWTVTPAAEWITVQPASGGFGETAVTVTVAENLIAEARSSSVTVAGSDLSQVLSISQEAAASWITVNKESGEFTSAGGTLEITLETNAVWSAATEAAWIAVSVAEGTYGTQNLTLTIGVNDSPDARNGSVVFTALDKTVTVAIAQKGKPGVGGIEGGIDDWGDGGDADYGRK